MNEAPPGIAPTPALNEASLAVVPAPAVSEAPAAIAPPVAVEAPAEAMLTAVPDAAPVVMEPAVSSAPAISTVAAPELALVQVTAVRKPPRYLLSSHSQRQQLRRKIHQSRRKIPQPKSTVFSNSDAFVRVCGPCTASRGAVQAKPPQCEY
ncbi:MAG: hypothetical protein IPG64_16705 [Haliea sp.]|nr:hypothetical protein [Haliea sp.]